MTASTASEAFPKAVRLRRRAEFLKVQERGLKINADSLTAMVLRNPGASSRIGFTVSSKVGNAVVRNQVRRRLRELARRRLSRWPVGLEVVLIARPSASQASLADFGRAFGRIEAELGKRFAS